MPTYKVKRKAISVAGGQVVEPGQTIELTEAQAKAWADNLESVADEKAAAKITAAEEKAAKEIAKAEAEAAKAKAKAEADAANAGGR